MKHIYINTPTADIYIGKSEVTDGLMYYAKSKKGIKLIKKLQNKLDKG